MTVAADLIISAAVLLVAVMNLINIKRITNLEKAVLTLEEIVLKSHYGRVDR